MEQQLSKAERNRIAVAKHRAKIGAEKTREVSKEYMKKYRTNTDIKQKENEKNKLRNKKNYDAGKKVKQDNTASITLQNAFRNKLARNTLNDLRNSKNMLINPVNSYVDTMLNDVFQNVINTVPIKRPVGRPRKNIL